MRLSSRSFSLLLSAATLALPLVLLGCPTGPGDTDGGDGDAGDGDGDVGDGDGDVNVDCPAAGGTICDVQNTASPNTIAPGNKATVSGVATTGTFSVSDGLDGFFLSDDPPSYYGGILVTVPVGSTPAISRGDIVDVTGSVTEFSGETSAGGETQLAVFPEDGDTFAVNGTGSIDPIDVSDLDTLNSESAEGVLVHITDVFVTTADSGGGRFIISDVNGDELQVGPGAGYFYAPVDGEVFDSLTGIIRYNTFGAGAFEISPRDADDIESQGLNFPSATIEQIRNPDASGYIAECAFDADCDVHEFANLVVTSPPLVVGEDDDSGEPFAFGFYVADPLAVNGSGELEPWSGTFVNFIPGAGAVRENSYSFGRNSDGAPFIDPEDSGSPGDYPQVGDVVTLAGQSKPYFDMTQVSDVVILRKEGTVDTLGDVTMPFPAQFDGAAASEISGGRPNNSVGPADDFNVTPSATIESWEGVLVELTNVSTVESCYPTPFNPGGFTSDPSDGYLADFGYFTVTGAVEIGTQFNGYFDIGFGGYWASEPFPFGDPGRNCANVADKCGDSREVGQTFTSITGVIGFSFDVWRVSPRTPADITPDLFVANNCQ